MDDAEIPSELLHSFHEALQKAQTAGETVGLLYQAIQNGGDVEVRWSRNHMMISFTAPVQNRPCPEW